MSYDLSATYGKEARKIEGTFPIDMYVVNASPTGAEYLYFANTNQNIYGFMLNASGNLTATEQECTALPIEREPVSSNTIGEIDGVTISIPNVDRTIEGIIQSKKYLRGQEVYIVTGFAKHLPSGSTATHIGETPDKNTFMKEKYYINSVTSNEQVISFNCKSKFTIDKAQLPRRTYSRTCTWLLVGDGYQGNECDPDSTITVGTLCDGSLFECRKRNNEKRFGGFPSVPQTGVFIA